MDSKSRLTVEELQLFSNQLDNIPIKVSGKDCVTQLLEQVVKFKETAQKLLTNNKLEDLEELKKVIETGNIIKKKYVIVFSQKDQSPCPWFWGSWLIWVPHDL